jgi:ABC-type multidrug transport system ATPase subunit
MMLQASPDHVAPAVGTTAAPLLEARSVTVTFGDLVALRGVDLVVRDNERVALLGPNGAGKSTLLRALAGLVAVDAGSVWIGGGRLDRRATAARSLIGFLGHQSYLYPELSAQENLHLYARLYAIPCRRDRIDEVLDMVRLSARRHQRVSTLSRGMIQRLAIARATLHEPRLLLLDEPDAGLDEQALDMLERVLATTDGSVRPRAAVLTTHVLEHACRYAERIVILNRGRVVDDLQVASMSVSELRARYREEVDGRHAWGRLSRDPATEFR